MRKIREYLVKRKRDKRKEEADEIVALLRNPNVVFRQERRDQIADLIQSYQDEIEAAVKVYEQDDTHGNI